MRYLTILILLIVFGCSDSENKKEVSNKNEYFTVKSGTEVTFINVTTEENNILKIDFSEGKHLIFLFNEDCKICKENIDEWNLLTEKLAGKYNIYGLSVNNEIDLTKFDETYNCSFDLIKPDSKDFAKKFHLYEYPVTIFIKRGMVYQNWGGLLTPKRVEHILRKLDK